MPPECECPSPSSRSADEDTRPGRKASQCHAGELFLGQRGSQSVYIRRRARRSQPALVLMSGLGPGLSQSQDCISCRAGPQVCWLCTRDLPGWPPFCLQGTAASFMPRSQHSLPSLLPSVGLVLSTQSRLKTFHICLWKTELNLGL